MKAGNTQKKKVLIICGGQSVEHEVSLRSAYFVYHNLDFCKYTPLLLAISKKGQWIFGRRFDDLVYHRGNAWKIKPNLKTYSDVVLIKDKDKNYIYSLKQKKKIVSFDIVFPIIHGSYGEDGRLQGYLDMLNIPYIGCSVLSSALCMDKEMTKRLLSYHKVPVGGFRVLYKSDTNEEKDKKVKDMVMIYKFPLFIKPARSGSSVGVSKVYNLEEMKKGITSAFKYDDKVLIEEYIEGDEIECSVLETEKGVIASLPGKLKPTHSFYDYEAKYLDPDGAEFEIPAKLSANTLEKIQSLSIKVFEVLECSGMARVDFFLRKNKVYINEVNTIPGFTDISMYPKLWQVSGISYKKLLDILIKNIIR